MTNTIKQTPVNRNYKARIFEMVFSDKKELLALYNAVNGTNHENPEELEINTLENAINECIQEGILKEFLTKHRAEARAMSIYEYDEEKTMRQMR